MALLGVGIVQFGRSAITLTGDVTLTLAQQKTRVLEFGGTPGGACAVTLYDAASSDGLEWIVSNASGQNVTLKASGGTGITVATARTAIIRSDGTDTRRVTADNVIT